MYTLAIVGLITVGVVNALLSSIVFFSKERTPRHIFFSLFSFAILVWAVGVAGFLVVDDKPFAEFWARTYYVAAAVIGYGLLGFAYSYYVNEDTPKLRDKIILSILLLPLLIVAWLSIMPGVLVYEVTLSSSSGNMVVLGAIPYAIYSVYFLSYMAAFVFLIVKKIVLTKDRRLRAHLQFILTGILLAGTFGILFNLILPLFGNYRLIWAGPLFTSAMAAVIFYAIIRHGLFDIRRAVAQTVAYALSLVSLVIVYGMAVFGVSSIFFAGEDTLSLQNAINIALAAFIAFTFRPLRQFFDQITDNFFFRHDYNPQELLNKLSDVYSYEVDVDRVSKKTAHVLETALKSEFVSIHIFDGKNGERREYSAGQAPKITEDSLKSLNESSHRLVGFNNVNQRGNEFQKELEKIGVALAVKLETSRAVIGYVLLGLKKNGNFYNDRDVQVLNTLGSELALAIQNGLRLQEIRNFNATLQDKVDVATERLRSANAKLRRLDEAKDEFVSMASHQLRTPLTSVKGYVSMILEGDAGKITKIQSQLLGEAFTSSERMVHLINDFLNVSRLQTGKFILESKPVDLAKIVQQEVDSLQTTAQAHNMKLEYRPPSYFPVLYIDEDKIRQVLMNFIDNAIYYSQPRTTITVKLSIEDGEAVATVHDTGIGVPKAEQAHLFTKFFRATNARKQRPDGTGVGLFLAKKVIDAHGGSIVFESVEGEGSTFGFRLPVKKLSTAPKKTD